MTAAVRFGIPNINDTQTVTEMVASGCHMILFTTGAGSVVGQAVAPVIKGVSNSRVFQRLADDMDINGGTIADGAETIEQVGERIVAKVVAMASGEPSRSEALGHQEFVLNYKTYEPHRPGLPAGSEDAGAVPAHGRSPERRRSPQTTVEEMAMKIHWGGVATVVVTLEPAGGAGGAAPRTMCGCG